MLSLGLDMPSTDQYVVMRRSQGTKLLPYDAMTRDIVSGDHNRRQCSPVFALDFREALIIES